MTSDPRAFRRCAVAGLILLAGCSSGTARTSAPSPSTHGPASVATAVPGRLRLGADWTTYGGDAARSSAVTAGPDPVDPRIAWTAALDGRVYASPLVVGGSVVAATENGSLYALAGKTGQVLWRRHLTDPVNGVDLPCGNIDPLGITGTPVYDRATGLVFAVAASPGVHHVLYGVDARTGEVRLSRGVDVPGMAPKTHLQRGALLLSGTTVYIPYGGNYGDCGQYVGRVVGVPTTGAGALRSFAVPTRREAGIWAASGPVLLPGGDLLVTTGNGAAEGGPWDHSDALLRLSSTLTLMDGFAPRQWAADNSADTDLGSMGPLPVPGGRQVLAAGKGGNVFLLDVARLGGVGGETASLSGCRAFGGGAAVGRVAYLPCNDGILQVQVEGNRLVRGWRAEAVGSPLVVGHTVWVVQQDGTLVGLDVHTGHGRVRLGVGTATRFAKPAVSGNALLLPTTSGITAVQLITP